MSELLAQNWPLVIAALAIGIVIAWWIFTRNRKTIVTRDEVPEVEPKAKRNQALIDAPSARAGAEGETIAPSVAGVGTLGSAAVAAVAAANEKAQTANAPSVPTSPAPAPAAQPVPAAAASAEGDDLTEIKGLGPRLAAKLQAAGVSRFAEIAAWDDARAQEMDLALNGRGRVQRDRWVEQAQLLAAGDRAGFAERFGAP